MNASIPLTAIEQTAHEGEHNEVVREERTVDVGEIALGLMKDGIPGPFDSLEEITSHMRDYDIPYYNLVTEEELAAEREEEERQRLEGYVSSLCSKQDIDSSDVGAILTALVDIQRAVEDRQYGMREDGLCIGWGCSSEQWYDEFNHIGSQGNEASRAFDWLADNAPLAFARWQERDTSLED